MTYLANLKMKKMPQENWGAQNLMYITKKDDPYEASKIMLDFNEENLKSNRVRQDVLILARHHLDYNEYDVQNALYGDVSVNFFSKPVQTFRTGDHIFGKQKNKRLSAVVHYEKILQNTGYMRKKTVFHNPFVSKKLEKEVFEGENVTQY